MAWVGEAATTAARAAGSHGCGFRPDPLARRRDYGLQLAYLRRPARERGPQRVTRRRIVKNVLLCSVLLLLAACQSSHVLVGAPRPPIDPSEVKVYLQPPNQYEQVALLEASSAASGAFTRQQKTDKVISRLKAEAAALGANGVLMQGMGNEYAGSVGTGSANAYGNSAFAAGFSAPIFNKAGTAIAIYVADGESAPAVASPQPRPIAHAEVEQSMQPASMPAEAAARTSAESQQPRQLDPAKRCDACKQVGKRF